MPKTCVCVCGRGAGAVRETETVSFLGAEGGGRVEGFFISSFPFLVFQTVLGRGGSLEAQSFG